MHCNMQMPFSSSHLSISMHLIASRSTAFYWPKRHKCDSQRSLSVCGALISIHRNSRETGCLIQFSISLWRLLLLPFSECEPRSSHQLYSKAPAMFQKRIAHTFTSRPAKAMSGGDFAQDFREWRLRKMHFHSIASKCVNAACALRRNALHRLEYINWETRCCSQQPRVR